MHMGKLKDSYNFMPLERAQQLVDSIYTERGNFPKVLKTDRPNIVVFLLEIIHFSGLGGYA